MADKTAEHRVVQSKSQLQNSSVSDTALQEDSDARGSSDGQKLTGDVIPKKRSTFKITSVTTTHTTPNSRGGDSIADQDGDSLDDLDESHTEDLSSDIYDLSSRIPDLDQDMLLTPEEVISKEKPSDSQSRFKVVKIETKEPFRRGRWFCHDYLDPPVDSKLDKQGDEIMVHSGNSSAGNSVHYVHGVDDPSKNPLLAGGTGTIPVSLNMSGTEAHNSVAGESFKPIHPASHPSQQPASQVTHIQSQRQSTPGLASADTSTSNPVPSQQQVPSNTTVSHPSVQSGNNQNPPGQSNSSQSIPLSNAQSVPQMPQSMNVKQSEQPYSHTPSAYGAQTGQISNNAMQPGSHYPEQQTFNSQPYSLTNINIPAQTPQPQAGQTSAPNAPLVANASIDSTTNVNTQNQMAAPGSAVPSATVQQPTVQQTILTNPPSQSLSATLSTGNLVGIQVNPSGEPLKENNSTTTSDKSEMLSNYGRRASMPDYKDIRTTEELQTLVQESSGIPDLTGPLLSVVVGRNSPARETRDESEGGASAVAIDNKIEQAMDLVKSHLMFAVREEVEVLKEQIKELVEKIGQLEYENSILRAAATPETLAKLQQQKALPPSSTS